MDHGLWIINHKPTITLQHFIPVLSLARVFVVFPKVLIYEKVPDFIVCGYYGCSILSS